MRERSPSPTIAPAAEELRVIRHADGRTPEVSVDLVATEEPLELRVEGQPIAVLMRTPGHDEELAAGFLLTEGVVHTRADLFEINPCRSATGDAAGNAIDVLLARPKKADLKRLTRHLYSGSSCGICGKATIESVHQQFPPLAANADEAVVTSALLQRLSETLAQHQTTFRTTGGLHAAALARSDGSVVHVREDVGRHNAVDKVLGRALLDDLLPLDAHVLFVSGRVSFEIVQKALAARLSIVAGISAPTSLAVAFARASGQTLAGFVRQGRMNVYAGAERLRLG